MEQWSNGAILNFNLLFYSFALLFFCSFVFPLTARALSIAPVRHTAVVDPGQKTVVRLTVANDSEEANTVTFEVDAFTIEKKTGRPIFGAADPAKAWITAPPRLTLAPGEQRNVRFTVAVPEKAAAGGHYLGLFVKSAPTAGQVRIGSRVGTLLFLYVGGAVQESLVRQDFSVDKAWYLWPPVHLSLQLENIGTVHSTPEGAMIIRRDSGREIARLPLNPRGKKVLPGGFWREEYEFRKLGWRDTGRVTAVAMMQYGVTKQAITDTITFWYVPLPVLLAAALLPVVLIILTLLIRRGVRFKR